MGENIQVNNKIWIDYLRAISTIAVIFIHVSGIGVISLNIETKSWLVANFYDSVSRFCVPVFFMISGSLLLNKDYKLKEFFIKRGLRILPPLFFWSIIYFIFHNKGFLLNNFDFIIFLKKIIRSLLSVGNYHLRFVYILIGLYLCVPILRIWIKNSPESYLKYFLVIWLFSTLYKIPSMSVYLPKIDISYFSGYLGYMILGYFLYIKKNKNTYLYLILFIVSLGFTTLGTYYFSIRNGFFYEYFYNYLSLNIIIASSSIFLFFKNVSINISGLDSVIKVISKYSFGVYLVHALILMLLSKLDIDMFYLNPILSIPLISILCLIISLIIVILLNKLPYGKYISG